MREKQKTTETKSVERVDKKQISPKKLRLYTEISGILCYLAVLIAATVIYVFAGRRGNPQIMQIFYLAELIFAGILLAQKLLFIVLERFGVFCNFRFRIEFWLNVVWVIAAFAEFIVGCILFAALRWDLLLIFLVQTLVSGAIVFGKNGINYYARKNLADYTTNKSFVIYAIVTVFVIFAEVAGVLYLPKLPPVIDDIFAKERVLQYELIEGDETLPDGYYVKNVYYGVYGDVVVPKMYNNKPVVGVLSGAIVNDGTFKSFCLGEYNEDGMLESNVKVLQEGAIDLGEGFKTLTLPASLEQIGPSAIAGEELEEVEVYSKCKLSLGSFRSESLSSVKIMAHEFVPVDFTGNQNADVKIEVSRELYNLYRKTTFVDRTNFKIEGEEENDLIVIDFETGIDGYYLESKIMDRGRNRYIEVNELHNENERNPMLVSDTIRYNTNQLYREFSRSKPGYAFRGWYRDPDYTVECSFSAPNGVLFSESTTLYAKWKKVKTVELDWDNYQPLSERLTNLYYIEDESSSETVTFPTINDEGMQRAGYEKLQWISADNVMYTDTKQLLDIPDDVIRLKAQWTLSEPSLNLTVTKYVEDQKTDFVYQQYVDSTFDETIKLNVLAEFGHDADVTYTYEWRKGEQTIRSGITNGEVPFNYTFRDVADSGKWIFRLNVQATTGETAYVERECNVTIRKKDFDISDQTFFPVMSSKVFYYTGSPCELIDDTETRETVNITFKYDLDFDEVCESLYGPTNASDKEYLANIIYEKLGSERDNYNVAFRPVRILIRKKGLGITWEQENEIVYDGNEHTFHPRLEGINGTDVVHCIFDANPIETNKGNYVTSVSGIDNPNYELREDAIKTASWTISARNVTPIWTRTSLVYNGMDQGFEIKFDNLVDKDKPLIGSQFLTIDYGNGESYYTKDGKLYFTAKNVGEYTVSIDNKTLSNYRFDKVQETLRVTKAPLVAVWSTENVKAYTGAKIGLEITVSGFVNNEGATFDETGFDYAYGDNSEIVVKDRTGSVITFAASAVQQGEYSFGIRVKDDGNYSLTETTKKLTINTLDMATKGQWEGSGTYTDKIYSGEYQLAKYVITGLQQEDVDNITKEDFTVETDGDGFDIEKAQNTLKLVFKAKNAGNYTYTISAFNSGLYNNNLSVSEVTTNYTIKALPVSIQWTTNEDDDFRVLTYNTEEQKVVPTVKNLVAADREQGLTIGCVVTGNTAIGQGTYHATVTNLTGLGHENYIVAGGVQTERDWTIQKKSVTARVENSSDLVYNGQYKYTTVYLEGIYESDAALVVDGNFNFTYSSEKIAKAESIGYADAEGKFVFKTIDSGTHTATLTNHTLGNYDIKDTTYTIKIEQKEAEVIGWSEASFTYNRTEHSVFASIAACERADAHDEEIVLAYEDNAKTAANDAYAAKIIGVTSYNNNYKLSTRQTNYTHLWRIEPKTLDLSWTNGDYTYNAEEQYDTVSATNTEEGDETIVFTYAFTHNGQSVTPVNARESYVVTIAGISDGNYQLPSDENKIKKTFTIRQKTLSTEWTGENSYTYAGQNEYVGKTLVITGFPTPYEATVFNDLVYEENVSSEKSVVDGTTLSVAFTDCNVRNGGYSVAVSGTREGSNYVIVATNTAFLIQPKQLILSWYDTDVTYNASEQKAYVTAENLFGNDQVAFTYTGEVVSALMGNDISENAATHAGDYRVTVSGIDNENYTIEGLTDEVLEHTFFIRQKKIKFVWESNSEKEYDGTYLTYTCDVYGIEPSDEEMFSTATFVISANGVVPEFDGGAEHPEGFEYENGKLTFYALNAGTYSDRIESLDLSAFYVSDYVVDTEENVNVPSFTVAQRTLQYRWQYSQPFVYNGTIRQVTAEATNLVGADSVEFTYSENTGKDAQTYTARVTGISGNENYRLSVADTFVQWTITPAKLTTSWSAQETTYNGNKQNAVLTISGIQTGDTLDYIENIQKTSDFTAGNINQEQEGSVLTVTFAEIDAGTYNQTLQGSENPNYTMDSAAYAFTIKPLTIRATWSGGNYVYNAGAQSVGATIEDGLLTRIDTGAKDAVACSLSGETQTNAGDYTAQLTLTGENQGNYRVENATYDYSIAPKTLAVNTINGNNGSKTYDGSDRIITVEIIGFCGEDLNTYGLNKFTYRLESGSVDYAKDASTFSFLFKGKDAGAYAYEIVKANDPNYVLSENSTKTYEQTIRPRTVTLTWYSTSTVTYNGELQEYSVQVDDLVADDLSGIQVSDFTLSGADAYALADKAGTSLSVVFKSKNVNSYEYALSTFHNGNYAISDSSVKTHAFTIAQKALSIEATTGLSFTYSGSSIEVVYRIRNLATSDRNAYTLSNIVYTGNCTGRSIEKVGDDVLLTVTYLNAGSYAFNVGITDTVNYSSSSWEDTVVIRKATYDMSGVSFENNTVTYDGNAHSLSISGSLPGGVSVAYTGNGKTDVGTYPVTAVFTGDSANYVAIENMTATLQIDPATYDMSGVSFMGETVMYNGSEYSLYITGTMPAGVVVTYSGNGKTDAGEYIVTASFSGDARNYNPIDNKEATLTIEKANVTWLTFAGKTFVYDGTEKSIAIAGNLPSGISVRYSGNGKVDASDTDYTVTAMFSGSNKNYNLPESMTAKMKIVKATYDLSGLSFRDKTFTCDGTAHSIEVEGVPVGVEVSYDNNGQTDMGVYIVTATFATDSNHNGIEPMAATMTIDRGTYDMSGVRFMGDTFTYDGNEHSLTVLGELPDGVRVSYSVSGKVNAGTYEVVASFTGDEVNYYPIESMRATLRIDRKTLSVSVPGTVTDANGTIVEGLEDYTEGYDYTLTFRNSRLDALTEKEDLVSGEEYIVEISLSVTLSVNYVLSRNSFNFILR